MGLQPEDHFQMVQDYEREQDECNERLGKKGPRPVQCGAVYATPQDDNIEIEFGTCELDSVDLVEISRTERSNLWTVAYIPGDDLDGADLE